MTTGKRVVVLHPSDELYGSDRVLLHVVTSLADVASIEVWLPTDVAYPTQQLSRLLVERGVLVRRLDLPVLRRANLSVAALARLGRSAWRSWRELRRCRPDVVWLSTSATILTAPLARSVRARTIAHVHEVLTRMDGYVLALPFLAVQDVVTVSRAAASALPGRVRARARVVENATPPVVARQTPAAADGLRVLFAGRWSPRKGLTVLLDAWAGLGRLDAELVIAGGCPPSGKGVDVLSEVARRRLGTVRVAGEIEDLTKLMLDCDVVVVPSVLPESFGLVVAEAAACGRPVVASATGGLGETVVDGSTGWLIKPGDVDALRTTLAGIRKDEAARRGAAALRLYEQRWTPERFRGEMVDVLLDLSPIRRRI